MRKLADLTVLDRFYERWTPFEDKRREISDDLKELFAELKAAGLTPKSARIAFAEQYRVDNQTADEADKRASADDEVELYIAALARVRESDDDFGDDDDQTVDAEQEEFDDDDAAEHTPAARHGPSTLAPPPDELGTAGDDRGEPDALNTEPGVAATTGAGLNPLSPSEEAAPPVNQSTQAGYRGSSERARSENTATLTGVPAPTQSTAARMDVPGAVPVNQDPEPSTDKASGQPFDRQVKAPDSTSFGSAGVAPAGTQAPPVDTIPEPERAAVGEKPGTAVIATTGAAGHAVAPVASPNSHDGLYSADWLRRHGYCRDARNCIPSPGRLCIGCSRTIAVVAGGKSIPHQGVVNA